MMGTKDQLDEILWRSEDSKRANTAYVERLHLFLRRSSSYLHRRTSGRVRNHQRLASAVELVRTSYNFIRPHSRLRLGKEHRTPAMLAGAFDRPLSWREVFSWPLRPPTPADVVDQALAIAATGPGRQIPQFVSQAGICDVGGHALEDLSSIPSLA